MPTEYELQAKFLQVLDGLDELLRLEQLLELLSEQVEHLPAADKYSARTELLLDQYRATASPLLHEMRSLLGSIHAVGKIHPSECP